MTAPLTYRGLFGTFEQSRDDGVFHGRLIGLRDLVTFESSTASGLPEAFREAVDDYLASEQEDGG